ncbi:glycosyltransferase involved in cell wall biosynthesis [Desulfohalotomaculum tongense]|uniref:glycosyltransferase n=1 Tax=Desulforadius tongensis TaxID=1216062 RepID=UPI00195D8BF7|nr:glycosyltransferase [Desulforadius tongensis]MBM7853711.1 glycosyltransferase involved in cell wall biosynthesis [Desulforadius tongensis]
MDIQEKLPLVSVVIPCYNYGRYVREAVYSVLNSTYPNIEIIVVNDGSTDKFTLEVLKELEREAAVIHQENRGLPGARNAGFKSARGKYVLPLDADDIIASTYLETATWLMEKNPDISFVYSDVKLFGEQDYIWYTSDYNFPELLLYNYIPATALVRKEAWEKAGGYDENMIKGYEDWEFWIRLGLNGFKGKRIKDTLFYYRKHGPSMLNESNKHRSEIVKYIRKKHRSAYINPLIQVQMLYYVLKNRLIPKLPMPKLFNRLSGVFFKAVRFEKDVHYISMTGYQKKININKKLHAEPRKISKKNKVPVLILLPWLEVGGVEQVFYNLLSCLDRSRFNVYIITTLHGTNLWKDKFLNKADGVFHLPYFIDNYKKAEEFILDFIAYKSIRIVHISNSKLGYYMAPLIKKYYPEVKIIDTLHMDEPNQPWDYFRVSDLVKEYLDVRVVLTNYFKDLLINKFNEEAQRIVVIPNGINMKPFPRELKKHKVNRILDGKINFGFIGRLHRQKQPIKFLQIAHRLINLKEDLRFLIIGDGEMRTEVQNYINRNKLNEHIKMLGFRDDAASLLINDIDVLLAPSEREGLPVVGIEALAASVPIVASKVPGWDQMVDDGVNGFLIPSGEIEVFVDKCQYLINNRSDIFNMAEKAHKKGETEFDRERMTAAYESIYFKLTGEQNSRNMHLNV